jgi:hypothetical protein
VLVCLSDKREEVCKSKVLRRKFVPEKKEVPKVIISVMEFRNSNSNSNSNSPTGRDDSWLEGERFTNTARFRLRLFL